MAKRAILAATAILVGSFNPVLATAAMAVVTFPDGTPAASGPTDATLAAAQLLVGSLNYACVAGCLYETLLPVRDVTYTDTVLVYALADAATLLTHAPGGIGVVEWVVLTLLPGSMVVGALVIFRCVYYFVPLCLGIIALAVSEVVLRPQSTKSQRPQRLPPLLR